ncbi:MAG: AbrB/MazE/SpoVT family DNA-binding domain-containing protein [Candidatus Bathyarchaeia archaeon]
MAEPSESIRERVRVLKLGRVTIPKTIREKLNLREGSILEVYLLPSKNKPKIVMELLAR